MDDLDKQLAELALLNNTELAPNPQNTLGKKVGPAVPPKPKKQQPQVPQSYSIKQNLEPSYASRLQNTSQQFYQNLPNDNIHNKSSSLPSSNLTHSNVAQHTNSASATYANIYPDDSSLQYSNLPRNQVGHAMQMGQVTMGQVQMGQAQMGQTQVSQIAHMGQPQVAHISQMGQAQTGQMGHVQMGHGQVGRNNIYANHQVPNYSMGPKGYAKTHQDHVTYSNVQVGGGASNRNPDGLIYSNLMHPPQRDNVYSNLPQGGVGGNLYANGEDLPPPPPPLELQQPMGDYAPCTVNTNFPPPPDELPPPPSPVSSSYSELRRATQPNQDYNSYGLGSQSSSTYESIYEPINPRPPSQMSSRSNYSLYAPYVSGASSHLSGPSQSASRIGIPKEQEVDALTDLLVQGMENEPEGDVYGICVKCGEKVVGENSGCTAMDKIYHTKCFTCHHCAINLQGKPFYALDGKPYCEEDYLNTLEKCCVCLKPILDRILRATGKPYHPKCFCCVICGKSLDGIPFTVDATNQIHCIEDFHKKFAPRCCVCKQPIMPEPGQEETVRVVALDRSFHIQCYKCEDCGLVLSSEAEGRGCYPLDDHVLCKSCNAKRVQALTSHMTTEL